MSVGLAAGESTTYLNLRSSNAREGQSACIKVGGSKLPFLTTI